MKYLITFYLSLCTFLSAAKPHLKLDCMVINASDGYSGLLEVSTASLAIDTTAFVAGYYVPGDGGLQIRVWDGTNWKLPTNEVNVMQFGAKGDGITDDTAAFTAAVAVSSSVIVPQSTGEYQVTGDFSAHKFYRTGAAATNNATIDFYLIGSDGVIESNGTNTQVKPIGSKSYSYYHNHAGATSFWGGGSDSGTGQYAGITIYGKDHPTFPQDIKMRSKNEKPLWFKATSTLSYGAPNKTGYWAMDDYSLIDVDIFRSTALEASASLLRMKLGTNEIEIGSTTSGEKYEIDNRNDGAYLQLNGGTSQATGCSFRLYGGVTGAASTNAGMIMYADNAQVFRFRKDLSDFDLKANTHSNISDRRAKKD